jgi:hypothetical protein
MIIMSGYINEPFLLKVIDKYTKKPGQLNVKSVIKYFQTKKNVRNGKEISNGSKVSQISTFKKTLFKIKDTPKLSELKMSLDMMNQVNQDREDHRTIRNTKQDSVTKSQVNIIMRGLKSDKFEEVYPALLLVSGRKPSDIYTMDFKKGSDRNSLIVKKTLNRLDTGCDIEYSVPLLVSYNAFIQGVKKIRLLYPELSGMTVSDIAKKFSKTNANAMLELSKKMNTKLTSSDMRVLYVNRMYFNSDKSKGYSEFVMDVINSDPIDVSQNYSKITVL